MRRLLLVAALLLGGCAAIPWSNLVGSSLLAGRTFLSTRVTEGGVERPLVAGTGMRLEFADLDHFGARAGCNQFGGTYYLDGAAFVVSQAITTLIACGADLDAQEQWLSDLLRAHPSILLDGYDLSLTAGSKVARFLDSRAKPDWPLVDSHWVVTTIFSGGLAMPAPDGVTGSLDFSAGGTMAVATGCNTGTVLYRLHGSTISVRREGLTKRACTGDAALVERTMLSTLHADTLTFEIRGDELRLDGGRTGLDLSAR